MAATNRPGQVVFLNEHIIRGLHRANITLHDVDKHGLDLLNPENHLNINDITDVSKMPVRLARAAKEYLSKDDFHKTLALNVVIFKKVFKTKFNYLLVIQYDDPSDNYIGYYDPTPSPEYIKNILETNHSYDFDLLNDINFPKMENDEFNSFYDVVTTEGTVFVIIKENFLDYVTNSSKGVIRDLSLWIMDLMFKRLGKEATVNSYLFTQFMVLQKR